MNKLLEKYEKYKGYREVYLNKNNMDKLILEIEKLNPIMVYAGTPVD